MSIGELSSTQCWDFIQKNQTNSYLIDVRTNEEWKETGVADLSSINNQVKLISLMIFTPYIHINDNFLNELNKSIIDKNTNLFFICKSGGRSLKAAQMAIQDGYINSYNVNDGFVGNMLNEKLNGWMNSKLPRKML